MAIQGKTTPPVSKSPAPKITWKHQRSFRHDLFKLELAKMQKNISWKSKRPELIPIDHNHIFHSHTSSGTEQKYSAPVGAHFHLVEPFIDPQGNVSAKCGPALRKIDKKLSNGSVKTLIEPLTYTHEEYGAMVDDHTHEVTYLGSETINPDKIRRIQGQNAQNLEEMRSQDSGGAPEITEQPDAET